MGRKPIKPIVARRNAYCSPFTPALYKAMVKIAESTKVFSEAYKIAAAQLSRNGIVVTGETAERLGANIRLLIKAGRNNPAIIAAEAILQMR